MKFLANHTLKFLTICALCMGSFANIAYGLDISYYSKATGNANDLSTWGTNPDGSGTSPSNFTSGDEFNVRTGSNLTTSAAWTIDQGASTFIGGALLIYNGATLTASHNINFVGTGSNITYFQIFFGGKYVHAVASNIRSTILSAQFRVLDAGSTFEISVSGSHDVTNTTDFSNFTVSGSSSLVNFVNVPGARGSSIAYTLRIGGILSINSGCTLQFSSTNNSTGLTNVSALTTSGAGLLRTSSISGTNLPSGITWNFQVNYDGASDQIIQPGTYINLNTTGGNRTVNTGSTITLSGTFTPGAGTFTINTGSTFIFSANGSLTIPTLPYQNLTISGTGTKTLGGNLTVEGTLTITNSSGFLSIGANTLTLNGDATLTNGKLIGSSSSNLTVSGTSATNAGIGFSQSGSNNQLNTFTLNRSSGGAILQDNLNIINRLVITAGNLNTNNNTIGLISSGISSTARVDQVGGSISYGTSGGVRVERYITAGFRSYRDLTPTVQTFSSSIYANWQEGGSAPTGYGTHITGVVGTPGVDVNTGLDKTQTGNASMFTYNGTTFPTVTNTASTQLDPYRGYRVLIRGDRNVNLLSNPTPTTMNTATVLRATGKLIYGNVTFSTSGVSNGVHSSSYALTNSSTIAFSLIGNPYACPVSWGKVLDNAGTANIQSTYWYFDPTLGINGVYATWIRTGGSGSEAGTSNGTGSTNNFIQPGQAIFVRNNSSTSPAVQFTESNKAVGSSAVSVFNSPTDPLPLNKIGIILHRFVPERGNVIMDGAAVLFGSNNSNDILSTEDAGKITNGNENLALVNSTNGTNLLSIESRKLLINNDSIPLRLWRVNNNTNYTLNIIPTNFLSNGTLTFLRDRYLNKDIYIKPNLDTTKVEFTTLTTDSSSFFTRFAFIAKQPIPIQPTSQLVSLSGTLNGSTTILSFKPQNELNLLMYDVEKSINGIEYTTLTRIYSNGSSTYSYTDSSLPIGKVYYRIKTYQYDAGYFNSNIVMLETDNKLDFVSVYPNPVTGNSLNVQMNQLEKGNYRVSIINNEGKVLFAQTINHNGSSATQQIQFNRNFTNGVYRLQLVNGTTNKQYSTKIIFTNR